MQPIAGLEAELWSFCAAAVIAPIRLVWDGKLFQTVTNAAVTARQGRLSPDATRAVLVRRATM